MPLLLFMVLGTLQLFTLLQGRILAQYAVGRATRMGSLNHGKCQPMIQSAIAILMPAIDPSFASATNVGAAYANQTKFRTNKNEYTKSRDGGRDGPIIWIDRVRPFAPQGPDEEDTWNLPEAGDHTLEVRMTFWFPLKVPFANWVFARLALAHWGLEELHSPSPYMLAQRDGKWVKGANAVPLVAGEMKSRYLLRQYVFPIQATYAMRLMSPARFDEQNCQ